MNIIIYAATKKKKLNTIKKRFLDNAPSVYPSVLYNNSCTRFLLVWNVYYYKSVFNIRIFNQLLFGTIKILLNFYIEGLVPGL